MAYRKYRSYRRSNKDKYSIEQRALNFNTADEVNGLFQNRITIVAPSTDEGMRKVKHLTVNLTTASAGVSFAYWALVYVPNGYNANYLNTTDSLYEPSQFVMNSGIVDVDAGPLRFSSPLSRNLNQGDSIVLIVGTGAESTIRGVVKYAITLQ